MKGHPSPAPRSASPDEAAPVQLVGGRYSIEDQLGRGGAAAVFRAVDVSNGRKVALKRLSANASPRLCSLFELEYHTLSTVKHKNIVEVYDYGSDALGPYYVMELLAGQDLSHQRRMPFREAAHYACEVASALSVLHARRLVHRDVSARNVWRLPDGNLKLIDFGALARFGTCGDVVGTPPHVAPEALQSRPLDQRTDLYALGALLYWLLTGTHAYPARSLRELPRLWATPCPSVLEQLERLGQDPRELPEELDTLVMALLSDNPLARPANTGEVIDRLCALLGLAPAARSDAADLGLSQPALTGRERERKEFQRQLEQLGQGYGQTTMLGARRGDGRTRLLNELAVDARIFGAHVVHVQAKSVSGSHGVADAVVLRLLDGLPEVTRSAAQPHAGVLGHLSREVEERLGVPRKAIAAVAGEARANIHEALSALLVEISQHAPLVILVDDLEHADESSMAWFATLALHLLSARVLLCLALEESSESDRSPAIKALRNHGRRIALKSLTAPETHKLLGSLFGEVPYLVRLSERLYRATQGNPARVVALSRHLVREGVITNLDGTWVLPQELPDELLRLDAEERVKMALARLSAEARTLGAAFSVRRGPLPLEMCQALSDLPSAKLFSALDELTRDGILSSTSVGYHFEDELYRRALRYTLRPEESARYHRRLSAFLLAQSGTSASEQLNALVHAVEGGDLRAAPDGIARRTLDLNLGDPDTVVEAAPVMERAVKVMRGAGIRDTQFAVLLGTLLVAGYFSDRHLVARYGERSVDALASVLRVRLMLKLRPWLGKRLSFFVGLIAATIGLRLRPPQGKPSLRETIQLYFQVISSYAGVNTICVDAAGAMRLNRLLEPFTALGKDHVASFMHEFTQNLALTVQDRYAEASARWQACIEKLDDPGKLRDLPEHLKARYLGGALYAQGVLECWRDSPLGLANADRLERFGVKLYQMSADQLRSIHYAHQGDAERYERYRARAEQHAIQRGSAWQIETWAPGASLTFALRTADAMALKESHEQLARLEKRIPSLALLTRRARGAFLLLRRRFEQALPLLEECLAEPPLAVVGWARAHGVLAACLNQLGEHQRALEVCKLAIGKLSEQDLSFTGMTLFPQIELARAEAGLGELGQALARLDALIEMHRPQQGPLTMGALHEARARVALAARDKKSCEEHALEMERYYLRTGIASLAAVCDAFRREQRRAFQVAPKRALTEHADTTSTGSSFGTTALDRALGDENQSLESRVRRALGALVEDLGEDELAAALFVKADHDVALGAFNGEQPSNALHEWVEERLRAIRYDDVTQTDFAEPDGELDPDVFAAHGARHRLFVLSTFEAGRHTTVGALLFAEPSGTRHMLPQSTLTSFAQWLQRNLASASVTTSLTSRLTQDR